MLIWRIGDGILHRMCLVIKKTSANFSSNVTIDMGVSLTLEKSLCKIKIGNAVYSITIVWTAWLWAAKEEISLPSCTAKTFRCGYLKGRRLEKFKIAVEYKAGKFIYNYLCCRYFNLSNATEWLLLMFNVPQDWYKRIRYIPSWFMFLQMPFMAFNQQWFCPAPQK